MAAPVAVFTPVGTTTNILVNTRTQSKIVYLPAASTIGGGKLVFVKDICGNAANSSIFISTTGLDSFDYRFRPSTLCALMSTNNGSVLLAPDGVLNWLILQFYSANIVTRGFSPTQITGLLVWTDASTLNLANNATLTTWTNGGSQGTVNCTGTFLTNQLNGLGVVRLTTAQTWSIATQPTPAAYSMFSVTRQRGGTNRRILQSASGNYLYGYWNGRKNVLYVENNPSFLTGLASDSAWDLFSHTRTQNSAYTFNYNGTSQYSGASSLNGPLPGLTINTGGSGGESSDCDVAEILLYDTSLSLTQVQQLEGYLAWKWGLQGNLPANHPFKNSPPQ
jgi:hypothetical protein